MKMTELSFEDGQPPIDGYAPDGFRVAGAFFEGAVILAPSGAAPWSGAGVRADLDQEAAAPLERLSREVDIVLLGVGSEIGPLPGVFKAAIEAAGLRFDVMGTPAACRTYNVLLTEDRRVAAALLTIGA